MFKLLINYPLFNLKYLHTIVFMLIYVSKTSNYLKNI